MHRLIHSLFHSMPIHTSISTTDINAPTSTVHTIMTTTNNDNVIDNDNTC